LVVCPFEHGVAFCRQLEYSFTHAVELGGRLGISRETVMVASVVVVVDPDPDPQGSGLAVGESGPCARGASVTLPLQQA
jgi:hypothetical protein